MWRGKCVRACLSGWRLRKGEKASASSNHRPQPKIKIKSLVLVDQLPRNRDASAGDLLNVVRSPPAQTSVPPISPSRAPIIQPCARLSALSASISTPRTHSVFTANGRPISPAIRTPRRDSLWRPQPFSPPPPPEIRADQPTRPNLSYRPADFGPLHSLPQPPQPPECALEVEHLEAHNRIQIFVHVGNPCTTLHRPEWPSSVHQDHTHTL